MKLSSLVELLNLFMISFDEIIVVNDKSKDNTLQIVTDLKKIS